MATATPPFPVGTVLLHCKSGRHYEVLLGPAECSIEAGRVPAYAYRLHAAAGTGDPMVWVRPACEMEDGRFVPVARARDGTPG
jgi:hypothetical protein